MKRPRIVLHIGRNKAGSTTLQDACLRDRAALLAQGVDYVHFGHLSDARADVPGFATFEALRAHAWADPQLITLVSHEFMFGWFDAFTEHAARVLVDCDVTILAYIRRYDHWIVSAYAEETGKGMNRRDIDAYAESMEARTSAWPYLRTWAEGFGWNALRVRDIDARDLQGGDLLADFAGALGVAPLGARLPPSNRSPHWLEVELVRRLAERNGDTEWAGVSWSVAGPLAEALRPLLDDVTPTVYLRPEHERRLLALYDADLARIEAATGRTLSRPSPPAVRPREAAPSFADAPPAVLAAFFARTTDEAFGRAHPEAARRARLLAREATRTPGGTA